MKRKSRIRWMVSVPLMLLLVVIGPAAYGYWTDRLNSSGTATLRQKVTISVQGPINPVPEPSAGPTPNPTNPAPEKKIQQLPDPIPDEEQPSAKPVENPNPAQNSKQGAPTPDAPDQKAEEKESDRTPQNTGSPQETDLPGVLRDSPPDKGSGNPSYNSKIQERKLP